MHYTCTVEIDVPVDRVVELWTDETNFPEWQDGFEEIQHLSGQPGTEGSKSKIVLQQGKRTIELTETILTANLPEEYIALYEHTHMTNTQTTRFQSVGGNRTRYISEVEYTEFNGIIPKIMAKIFPGMFKKQSQKWMDQFKAFAEQAG